MVNNAINVNKTNNHVHLSPQIIEHERDNDNGQWKSRFCLETAQNMAGLNRLLGFDMIISCFRKR